MKRNAQWGNWKKKQINQENDWKQKQLKEYDQIKKKLIKSNSHGRNRK